MPRLTFANQLRGFAALCVVGSHLVGVYWGVRDFVGLATASPVQGGDPPRMLYGLFHLLYLHFGPFGVGVFFLISGLVIPISLERHGRGSFLAARALRIFPTYLAALLVQMAVVLASAFYWGKPWFYGWWTIASNALLIHDFAGRPSIDLVNWTLCIELKFYLLMALLAGPVRRGSLAALFAVPCLVLAGNVLAGNVPVAGASPSELAQALGPEAVFVVFMLVGVLFNYRWRGLLSRPAFLWSVAAMLALFAACWWESPLRAQFRYVMCNYFYAFGLFGLLFMARDRFRPVRALDLAAAISFPLYLVHALLGFSVLKLLTLRFEIGYLPSLGLALCAVAGVAYALHRTVEAPTMALGRRLARPAAPAAGSRDRIAVRTC